MSSAAEVREAVAGLRAAYDTLAACDLGLLTAPDLLALLDELETLGCQLPTPWHRALTRLQTETTPQAWGAKSWRDVISVRWRLAPAEASRRLATAAVVGPRQALGGEPLDPVLPATAAAQGLGAITADHVDTIRRAVAKTPGFVDDATRTQFEVDLVRTATGGTPKQVEDAAELALFLMDQDGPEPTDDDRDRKRGITVGKQRTDGTTAITGTLSPEARAVLEPIFAKYAAPGMCNPADPQPCTSGTPSQDQIDDDHRTLAQRQHDALIAVGRIAMMSGTLGHLNGLPVSIIIRTTLQDLESRAGIGTTAGGTRLPIRDVIRMGAHAHHSLAVFDRVTGSALELFRAKRVASPAQRIMLIARDGGCTKPGCTVPAYGTQAHHAVADWTHGGLTNVDDMGLACGTDNRSVDKNGGWTTRMNAHHEVEWIPPEHLDTGQTRINTYHTPEKTLHHLNDPPPDPQPLGDNQIHDDHTADAEGRPPDPDPEKTETAGHPGEPGGPEPPHQHCG